MEERDVLVDESVGVQACQLFVQRQPAGQSYTASEFIFSVEADVEREGPALAESTQDNIGGADPSTDLRLYQGHDVLRGFLYPSLVLGAVRIERLEVEPRGHREAGVESDGHLVGAGADELHPGRLDGGQRAGPAVAGVSEAVEEDDGGRLLAGGRHYHGLRPAAHRAGSLLSQPGQCLSHTCVETHGSSESKTPALDLSKNHQFNVYN